MINVRRLSQSELKTGMTILTVCFAGKERLERIDCLDNGRVYLVSVHDMAESHNDTVKNLFNTHASVFEVSFSVDSGRKPETRMSLQGNC